MLVNTSFPHLFVRCLQSCVLKTCFPHLVVRYSQQSYKQGYFWTATASSSSLSKVKEVLFSSSYSNFVSTSCLKFFLFNFYSYLQTFFSSYKNFFSTYRENNFCRVSVLLLNVSLTRALKYQNILIIFLTVKERQWASYYALRKFCGSH